MVTFNRDSNAPRTWMACKEKGKTHYERGEYETALSFYREALNPDFHIPSQERQILLSNVVACRLKIGGPAQARAAIEDAKQCIEINPSWSKGHVRLASAYISLTGHSNDACNELQTALRLDPGNVTARQMLVRELRRDHASSNRSSDLPENSDIPAADTENHPNPPSNSESTTRSSTNSVGDSPIDDNLPFTDRVRFLSSQIFQWYSEQTDDVNFLMKICMIVVVLYVAFGGRFGLGSLFSRGAGMYRGNYGTGNAYDRYNLGAYQSHDHEYHGRRESYDRGGDRYRGSSWTNNHRAYDEYSSSYPRRSSYHGGVSNSYHFPNLLDGSLVSMALLAGVAYVCHLNGINPFHAIWMMNVMGRPRRGFFGPGMMGYGGGYGMGMPWGGRPNRARYW